MWFWFLASIEFLISIQCLPGLCFSSINNLNVETCLFPKKQCVCVCACMHLSQNVCQILLLVLVTFTEAYMTELVRDQLWLLDMTLLWMLLAFPSRCSAFSSLCTTLLDPIITFLFLSHARQLLLFLWFPIVLLTHALLILLFTPNNYYFLKGCFYSLYFL